MEINGTGSYGTTTGKRNPCVTQTGQQRAKDTMEALMVLTKSYVASKEVNVDASKEKSPPLDVPDSDTKILYQGKHGSYIF